MFVAELSVYAVALFVFLKGQTGRLKSGPDSGKVSAPELFDRDPLSRTLIASYLFLLMLFAVWHAFRGGDIDLGPWAIFISACPVFLIVFFRQHRLEKLSKPGTKA